MLSRREFASLMAAGPIASSMFDRAAANERKYPDRMISVVVGNTPGGADDLISRTLADFLTVKLGQTVIVNNKSGGATTIGATSVVQSKPDGYTMLCLTTSGIVQTVLRKNLSYNMGSFAPVAGLGSFPMALAVSAKSNIRSLDDLRAAVRQGNDTFSYASAGPGTLAHLTAIELLSELKGSGTHVSYRNNPDALQALASGEVQLMGASASEVATLREGGYIRVIAVTSEERAPNLPDVPTTRELGIPSINSALWFGFVAPSGTPADVIQILTAAIDSGLKDRKFQDRLGPLGFRASLQTGEALSSYILGEAQRWGRVITQNNIRFTD